MGQEIQICLSHIEVAVVRSEIVILLATCQVPKSGHLVYWLFCRCNAPSSDISFLVVHFYLALQDTSLLFRISILLSTCYTSTKDAKLKEMYNVKKRMQLFSSRKKQ